MQSLDFTFPKECCRCNRWTATRLWQLSEEVVTLQWYGLFATRKKQQMIIRVPVCEGCYTFLQTHKNEPANFRNGKLIFTNEEYQRKFTALNNELERKANESGRKLKQRLIG
jgi:hypothetical protein